MNTYYLYNSDKPNKKYFVEFVNKDTSRIKRIYFGAIKPDGTPYSDMLDHNDEERKKRYIARHKGMNEDWTRPSPGFFSRWLLWNTNKLTTSIKDTNERFNIKIINKTKQTNNNKQDNKIISKVLNEKPSAYRSMKLAKLGLSKPTNKTNKNALLRWQNELWENLTARITDGDKFYNCGTKGKKQGDLPSVCRPSIRIDSKTPKPLANEITNKQLRNAIEIKKKGKRIDWSKL